MPQFLPFEGEHTISRTLRNLPHWQAEGCTYFITFRQHDALPKSVVARLKAEGRSFLQQHHAQKVSELKPQDQAQYRKIIGKLFHTSLDQGHGSCVLFDPANSALVEDCLRHFDGQRYHLGDFVIMPNHVHLLVVPQPSFDLSKILHTWKSFTAKEINKRLRKTGPFWQKESYDHIVRNRTDLDRIIKYTAENPAKANLPPNRVRSHKATWTE